MTRVDNEALQEYIDTPADARAEQATAMAREILALRGTLTDIARELGDRYDGPDSSTNWMGSLIRDADTAIARAED